MAGSAHRSVFPYRSTRRSFLLSGFVTAGALASDSNSQKGQTLESEWVRYADPATEFQVYRLTDPAYSSTLPATYNRLITRNSGALLYCSERSGTPQAFRMDLKSGDTVQLTDRKDLDGSSLALLPDGRSFCYFADRTLYLTGIATLRERPVYTIPEGWERCDGISVGADGGHAMFGERSGDSLLARLLNNVLGSSYLTQRTLPLV